MTTVKNGNKKNLKLQNQVIFKKTQSMKLFFVNSQNFTNGFGGAVVISR